MEGDRLEMGDGILADNEQFDIAGLHRHETSLV